MSCMESIRLWFRYFFVIVLAGSIIVTSLLLSGCNSNTSSSKSTSSRNLLNWSARNYNVNCLGLKHIQFLTAVELNLGKSNMEVILLNCVSLDGAAPAAVLVYRINRSNDSASYSQMLLAPSDDWVTTGSLTIQAIGIVSLPVLGYKTGIGRCCPNLKMVLTWKWDGTKFIETSIEPNHTLLSVYPGY